MKRAPKKPCCHLGEYGWSCLYDRYGRWCKLEERHEDLCFEDWRKKVVECKHYKEDPESTEYCLAVDHRNGKESMRPIKYYPRSGRYRYTI